ncbi:Uncharacterised protein [Serratia fonticola]|uniref:hypothetical protein n=1 Tax=Serratia fonticola TaxID=47917 RepID=UPI0021778019|nr:hypothetical protein [Serratia fonticola]CAI1923059.1 Uncharacterised protein [Serratia fonticola]
MRGKNPIREEASEAFSTYSTYSTYQATFFDDVSPVFNARRCIDFREAVFFNLVINTFGPCSKASKRYFG